MYVRIGGEVLLLMYVLVHIMLTVAVYAHAYMIHEHTYICMIRVHVRVGFEAQHISMNIRYHVYYWC